MKIFYCKIPATDDHFGGFAIASGFNRGHAVKNISKQLEAAGKGPLTDDISVEEFDPLQNKNKGVVVFDFLEGLR